MTLIILTTVIHAAQLIQHAAARCRLLSWDAPRSGGVHFFAFSMTLPTTVSGSPCTFAARLNRYWPAIGRSVLKA